MKKFRFATILLIVSVFLSFISFNFMLKNIHLKETNYSLDRTGMNNPHKPVPPLFHLNKDKIYFIHPATSTPAKAIFKFKKNEKLLWHFSIQKGSPSGKILFIVKKNGEDLKKFTVDTKHDYKLDIKVRKNDKITIIADPAGVVDGDWGNLEIFSYESNYILKLILIPTLWVAFFIYLISKGYSYIAFNSYFGFILTLIAEKLSFGPLLFSNIIAYITFFFLFSFLFVLIYQELRRFKKYKIATMLKLITTIVIYMIPTSFIIFFLVYNKPIDWNMLFAIYQTNFNEALEFIKSFIPLHYLLGILLIALIMGYLFWKQEVKKRKTIERSLLIFIITLLTLFSLEYFFKTRIPNLIYTTYVNYNTQIERLIEFQKKRKASKIKFSATKQEKGETYVVVIGESLNRYNMGIYGYFRNTTPKQLKQIKEDNLQVFNNVYSNAANTMRSLSFALTEANQYNKKDYLESLSFIDIFNKAGFDTYWLSTQDIFGESNNIVSVLAESANSVVDLTSKIDIKTGNMIYYDENSIEELKKRLNKNKNRLIIIHMYGNHFRYEDRYPKEFSKYKNTKPFILGTDKKYTLGYYTTYDNSVYYNDYVVSKLLDVLKNHGGASCFLYFSDHAEDIARNRAHTSRLESFTFGMINIPLTAWLSPEYIKRYPKTYKTFISHKDELFSNDLIYDTLIGLAHIKTNHYNKKYDLSSSEYKLDPKEAMTLHSRLYYNSPKNYYFWREYNSKFLKDNNISSKIVIKNADTVGKLNEAWQLGYRSFELNLKYIKDKNIFQVGTKSFDSKDNMIDLLSYFKIEEIKNLFLNLTNINKDNIVDITARLDELNSKLNIKQKSIILLSSDKLVQEFKQKGWKVALYNTSTNIDFTIIDAKNYQKISDNTTNIILNNVFNIADAKLKSRFNSINYIYSKNIKFLFANFKSVFDD